MSILSGFFKTKKYRKTSTGYKLQSEWTSGSTVEMADGNTAETNLGAIKGITSSLTATNANVALSASAGKSLQDQITEINSNLDYGQKCYRTVSNGDASISFTNLQVTFGTDGTATATYSSTRTDYPGNEMIAVAIPRQEYTDTGYDYLYASIDNVERISDKSIRFSVTGRWMSSGALVTGEHWLQVLIVSSKLSSEL